MPNLRQYNRPYSTHHENFSPWFRTVCVNKPGFSWLRSAFLHPPSKCPGCSALGFRVTMIILGGKGTFPCFLKSTRPYITWVCLLGLRQVSASCNTSPSDGCCVYSNGKACASDGCPANAVCYPVYDCCLRPSHMHAHPSPVFRVVLLLIV